MAEYGDLRTYPGMVSDYDFSSLQYHFASANSYGTPSQPHIGLGTTGAGAIGVVINVPKSGQFASVAYEGLCKVVAGAATAYGAQATCNASGRAIAATSGSQIVGRFLEGAAADGDVVSVMLFAVGGRFIP